MPDYENDIFVSYRRLDEDWVRWTRDNFVRPLRSLLRPSLGDVHVFIDQNLETGVTWPQQLAHALARSRLLIPILCRDYFQSEWCRLELAIMQYRENLNRLRTTANPWGLIIPVIIDDGDCFPASIKQMQGERIHEYANPFIRIDSPKQEAFADRLREKLCPAIQSAIVRTPAFNPEWEQIALDKFKETFQIQTQTQKQVPKLSLTP